jgi:hypothetical protein
MSQRGIGPRADAEETEELQLDEPLVAELYSASVARLVAMGPCAGRRWAGYRGIRNKIRTLLHFY